MDGSSFIPPPFPFPEAWPRVFAEQQQRQEQRWLTPTALPLVQWPAAQYYPYPADQPIPAQVPPTVTVDAQDEDGEDDGEDEYEYGYVLSDEWRERFQSSVQLQQPQPKRSKGKKKKKTPLKKTKSQRQTVNAEAVAAASASRSGHLQREIQAAKTRELARNWKRRGGTTAATTDPQAAALETSLNMLFDEFCDAFQPVVWPHDPLQR
ncbi:hypothetical protein KRP22_004146 [Phytophthora ramorum]|nr:hypothetical protein KRP22_13248 [Phytophthora ramorum]